MKSFLNNMVFLDLPSILFRCVKRTTLHRMILKRIQNYTNTSKKEIRIVIQGQRGQK